MFSLKKNVTELSRNKASGDFSFFFTLYNFRHFSHTCTPVPLSIRFCSSSRAAENLACLIRKGFFSEMLCFATPNDKIGCWDRCFCENSCYFLRGPTAAGCAAPLEYLSTLQVFNKRYLNKVNCVYPRSLSAAMHSLWRMPRRIVGGFAQTAAARLYPYVLFIAKPKLTTIVWKIEKIKNEWRVFHKLSQSLSKCFKTLQNF